MNCTYCFNNNIPNHYQTGNSLSTECKGLCFHYDLLLKKTIFRSSVLSYLPNNPGSFRGEHQGSARLYMPHFFTVSELTFLHIYVSYYIIYLSSFSCSSLYSIYHAMIHTNGFVQFWNLRTS